jgi:hypothetical protein
VVTRVLLTFSLAAAAVLATQSASAAPAPPPPPRSLHVASLMSFTIGGRHFLGRTPIQITSAFGKPSARIVGKSTLDLRYGGWTIHFKRRKSDGKLLAASALCVDQALYGTSGRRLLAPWFGLKGIEGAVTREVEWVKDGDWNEWIKRDGYFDGADFPRRISWGIDPRGRRWLRLQTDLEVEFRG